MSPPPEPERGRRPGVDLGGVGLGVIVLVLVGIWVVGIMALNDRPAGRMELTYQELRRQVGEGNVATVVARGQELDGTFRTAVEDPAADDAPRTGFRARRPDFARDDLLKYLEANGVDVTAEAPQEGGSTPLDVLRAVLPYVLIGGVFLLLMRSARPTGAFGRTRARRYEPSEAAVTRFADVAGIEEAKDELMEVVDFLRDPEPYRRLGAAMPRGVLLYGPPGTGKTLLARAVAGEAGVPFFSLSASEFVEMFVGVGASRVRDLFAQAKAAAPAIVFIDELDAIGRIRMRGASPVANDEREQTLNQILAELDGFTGAEGVVVLAATNRPEVLDPALLRAGRFDRRISVNPPDRAGREAILAVHTRGIPLDTDVELGAIAATTPGMVGADLRALVNEAALTAARRRHERVAAGDFSAALERVLLGAERRIVISPEERRRTAYHEAGHALLATLVPGAEVVRKVSIVPHGQALGVTLQSPEADRHGYTEAELRGRVVAALGGRAAEEVVLAQISTGAEDDLEQVARIVRHMVERWGMSPAVGPNAVLPSQDAGVLTPASGAVSEETRRLVDAEVRRIVEAAHEEALTLLHAHRDRLEALAEALLERETLDEGDVRRIVSADDAPVSAADASPRVPSATGPPPH